MAFKPVNASAAKSDFEPVNLPTPKAGSRKARISLIVDMGVQNRPDFEEEDGTLKPQKPCQQVAVFADLVADEVDYGGKLGKKQYRLLLNKSFKGEVTGINFTATPPKDAAGNTIPNKPWGLHPANLLTKIAKAVGREDVIESMDIEELLDKPFMCTVEVKKTPHKEGKKDAQGNTIVYTNVNFKGAAPVPEDDDTGEPIAIKELQESARCITFDRATKEDIKFIRSSLLKQIKLANNYAGSQMQKAVEEYEAENGGPAVEKNEEIPAAKPEKKVMKPAVVKPEIDSNDDTDNDDGPPF